MSGQLLVKQKEALAHLGLRDKDENRMEGVYVYIYRTTEICKLVSIN